MNNRKTGFTLMEIMVVIIIIAVLASVAGPMITGITDQGKASATKSQMANLKTALINFSNDMGQYPHAGNSSDKTDGSKYAVDDGSNGFAADVEQCCLTTVSAGSAWNNFGIASATYNRRWKGPYMEGDPIDFFTDSWGNPIRYGVYKKVIYFHSSGADGGFDNAAQIMGNKDYSETGDDIIVQAARLRWTLSGASASPLEKAPKDVN